MNNLQLTNSLTNKKEIFNPINKDKVSLYACGPTVYDNPHVGNARALVVFDLLFRILIELYGEKKVTYVRNITDIDDKIIEAAKRKKIDISDLTKSVTEKFHKDCKILFCLNPTKEPKATDHVEGMINMTKELIEKNAAYEKEGHVFFAVTSFKKYGKLSNKNPDDLKAGARVEVSKLKNDPLDFVLWKPSNNNDPGWESPWGRGRPGWHLECSVMSEKYLGKNFDIHGGGLDLIFPHHENEIAQSCVYNGTDKFANYWVHNGFVTMNKEKMSKSLGNIISVKDAADKYRGETLRAALLSAHYRAPLDLSDHVMRDARNGLDRMYRAVGENVATPDRVDEEFTACLLDDLNTPAALARLHELARLANKGDAEAGKALKSSAATIGLLQQTASAWAKADETGNGNRMDDAAIDALVRARKEAREVRDFAKADEIRDQLARVDIILEDSNDGTIWRRR